MARCTFGGELGNFESSASVGPSMRSGTVWTAQTAGEQITDLLSMSGRPMTSLTDLASPGGFVHFQGPDDGTTTVWVQCQARTRVKLLADPVGGFARVVDEGEGGYPDRPTGAVCVIWRGETTPGAAVSGDIYVNTGV